MSNYSKTTDFAAKDALATGNANKIVKGTEIDDEFEALQTAVNSKADTNNAALTGTPTAPTAPSAPSGAPRLSSARATQTPKLCSSAKAPANKKTSKGARLSASQVSS